MRGLEGCLSAWRNIKPGNATFSDLASKPLYEQTDLLEVNRSNAMVLNGDLTPCDLRTLWGTCTNHFALSVTERFSMQKTC